MIPYGHQSIDDDDIAAVVGVLKGDWLTQGPHVAEFEEALAARVGARYAVAFSSGTAALHGAAAAACLGPGDVVATSPLSFAASATCARYVGATPVFVDIDPATLNLDLTLVPVDCAALVAVHFAGLPVDLQTLTRRPPVVIEDAAHALGAVTPDGPVGNCARSDMCTFSFHPVKTVTTGEGGAVTTNSEDLAERLRRFRNHDIAPKPDQGGWFYEICGMGFNYRMTDVQAALGTSQLGKLDRFLSRRTELAGRYRELLADLPVGLPPAAPAGWRHAYHLFPVQVPDRRSVYDRMRAAGIGVQVHYVPIYRHPLYADLGVEPGDYPFTEAAYAGLLSLPLFPDLTAGQQDTVVAALQRALDA
ncbi:MAG: aminotransferase class I/II-fold pyridoxal phosphate-dependent enzyme [Acidimicrobiales bacterium]|nr:aminotransferase class I/II-fold pyridoxal phosphate-dependent enzyme [Acidimicrobiales bacterium]